MLGERDLRDRGVDTLSDEARRALRLEQDETVNKTENILKVHVKKEI